MIIANFVAVNKQVMNGKEQAGCFVVAVAAVALLVICRLVSGGNDEMPSSSSKPHTEAADTAKANPLPRTPAAAPSDVPRRVARPADADDAYAEGYDNGYAQGRNDGVRGQYRGYGYDDERNAPDQDASRYREGYDDGYTDGYNSGQAIYNEGGDDEYNADIW